MNEEEKKQETDVQKPEEVTPVKKYEKPEVKEVELPMANLIG